MSDSTITYGNQGVIVERLISITFLLAGFSQIEILTVKPFEILASLTFLSLVVKGWIKATPLFVFFLFSIFYALFIGGLDDFKTFISNLIILSISFGLYKFYKVKGIVFLLKHLRLFVISIFFSNLIALTFFLFVPVLKETVVDISSLGIRFKGFFNQSNGYAYILLVTFPFTLLFLKRKRSLFNILSLIVMLVCLVLSQSRGVLISSIVAVVILYFIHFYNTHRLHKMIVPAVLTISVMYGLLTVVPGFLSERFGINLTRLNPLSEPTNDRSLLDININNLEEDWFYLIDAGLQTIAERPFGLGYQPHHLIIGEITGVFLIPHNYFLSLILSYGLIIGVIWIALTLFIVHKGFRKIRKLKLNANHVLFYFLMMIVSVCLFYLSHSSDWSYFYFFIGMYIYILYWKEVQTIYVNTETKFNTRHEPSLEETH